MMTYLIRLKSLYFCIFGAMGILFPIIPLFYESLSFSKTKIGVLTAIPPVTSTIFGPLWSILFDATQTHDLGTILAHIVQGLLTGSALYMKKFQAMVAIVLLSSVFRAPVSAQIDSHTIGRMKSKYGEVRLYGAISYGLLSFAGGTITGADASHFDAVFFIFMLFTLFSGFALLTVDLSSTAKERSPSDISPFTALRSSLGTPSVMCFLVVMVMAGTAFGIVESFLFIRLKQLGAQGIVLGLARLIMCFSEVPMFRVAPKIHARIGTWWLLCITQVVFVIRNMWYMNLETPLWVLPCEVLHGITFATMWSCSTTFAHAVAPEGLASTFQALLASIHFGVGCSVGGVVGGWLYDSYGGEALFCFNALVCTATAIITGAAVVYGLDDAVMRKGVLRDDGDGGGDDEVAEVARFQLVSTDETNSS